MKYPKIPAEGLIFREKFINNTYVSDNGGTASVGSVNANNGQAFADDLVINYDDVRLNKTLKTGIFSIRIAGILANVGTDGGAMFGWYIDGNNRFYIEFPRSGNTAWRTIANVNGGGALSGSGLALSNGYNEIVLICNGATWSAHLNGAVTSITGTGIQDLSGMVGDATAITIGGAAGGVASGNGTMSIVEIYDRVLSSEEISDLYQQDTFSEIDASKSLIWCPCKTQYNDGSQKTSNIGGIGEDLIVSGASVADGGFEYDGTDDYIRLDNTGIDNIWATGGSLSCLIKPYSDGEGNFAKIFDKANAVGWTLQVQDESAGKVNLKLSVKFDGGAGGDWTTSTRWLNLNQWNSVVVVYNGSNTTNNPIFYINGVKHTVGDGITETLAPVGTISPDNGVMSVVTIGNNFSTSSSFDGVIAVPALWDPELTQTQAKCLHERMFRELNL